MLFQKKHVVSVKNYIFTMDRFLLYGQLNYKWYIVDIKIT